MRGQSYLIPTNRQRTHGQNMWWQTRQATVLTICAHVSDDDIFIDIYRQKFKSHGRQYWSGLWVINITVKLRQVSGFFLSQLNKNGMVRLMWQVYPVHNWPQVDIYQHHCCQKSTYTQFIVQPHQAQSNSLAGTGYTLLLVCWVNNKLFQ